MWPGVLSPYPRASNFFDNYLFLWYEIASVFSGLTVEDAGLWFTSCLTPEESHQLSRRATSSSRKVNTLPRGKLEHWDLASPSGHLIAPYLLPALIVLQALYASPHPAFREWSLWAESVMGIWRADEGFFSGSNESWPSQGQYSSGHRIKGVSDRKEGRQGLSTKPSVQSKPRNTTGSNIWRLLKNSMSLSQALTPSVMLSVCYQMPNALQAALVPSKGSLSPRSMSLPAEPWFSPQPPPPYV